MPQESNAPPAEQPIRRFAKFFKAYGIGLSLVTAAIPLGVAQWDLLPLFSGAKRAITLITSVSCYLLVGFIFSQRHVLGRLYFPGRIVGTKRVASAKELIRSSRIGLLPAVLAFLSIAFFFIYAFTVNESVRDIAVQYSRPLEASEVDRLRMDGRVIIRTPLPEFAEQLIKEARAAEHADSSRPKTLTITYTRTAVSGKEGQTNHYDVLLPDEESVQALLKGTPSAGVPNWIAMGGFFLGAFLCAVTAFVLMGLKDYLQEELRLSDFALIQEEIVGTRELRFAVEGVPGLYGFVEFNPHDSEFDLVYRGPFCTWHDFEPRAKTFDPTSGIVRDWQHISIKDDKRTESPCLLKTNMTEYAVDMAFKTSGRLEAERQMRFRGEARA